MKRKGPAAKYQKRSHCCRWSVGVAEKLALRLTGKKKICPLAEVPVVTVVVKSVWAVWPRA